MMSKVLLFTDIHFTDGADIIGLDPMARFHEALDHALARHADADHLIIMGDLTHHGTEVEFQNLKAALARCPLPVTLMPGNHDRRAPFEAVFGVPFQQTSLTFGGHKVLCLDTLDEAAPDRHSGFMDAERLAWLKAELDSSDDPVIVLMHHALVDVGFDGMDAIKLRNGDQVAQVLAGSGKVRHVINGHIHRTIFTSAQGLPVAMIKGTCHQSPLILGEGSSAISVDEPGAYGILILKPDQAILHVDDVGLPETPIFEDKDSH